jgi:hypothetical protein
MTWLNVTKEQGYVPLVVNTFRSFPHSCLITRFVQVPLVEQEMHTPVFSGVRVARPLVFCVVFCRCFFFSFFFWTLCCLSFVLRILITLLMCMIPIRFPLPNEVATLVCIIHVCSSLPSKVF